MPVALRESTPPPQRGRSHAWTETDEFVETITDKPPRYEVQSQTEFIIEKPIHRPKTPPPKGTDKETQINDGDLFDFDEEVEPILSVILGRTIEESQMEVLEEEELKAMKREQ